MDDLSEATRRIAKVLAAREHDLIESACERALLGGLHGVLVKRTRPLFHVVEDDPSNGYRLTSTTTAVISPSVPYGEVHYVG